MAFRLRHLHGDDGHHPLSIGVLSRYDKEHEGGGICGETLFEKILCHTHLSLLVCAHPDRIIFSFNASKSRGIGAVFLHWYFELLQDRRILNALYNTMMIAVLSAVIATLIGTAAAIGIHNMKN